MKKQFTLISAAVLSLNLLAGCSSDSNDAYIIADTASGAYDGGYYAETASPSYSSVMSDEAWEEEVSYVSTDTLAGTGSASGAYSSAGKEIEREMLVYSCSMTIDVLDFEAATESFKRQLEECGGFIETESYDNGGSGDRWYTQDEEKWQSYTAMVRVPSESYDDFCNSAGELGDLRRKNAAVENLSAEYTDLSASLDIYEAKRERYIKLLADITDDEYAVAVEKELTELEVKIAQIKSRLNDIRTDVAYSYVNISINEVKEYVAEPVKKDTFAQRLKNTFSETGAEFVSFLEELLFFVIRIFPYLAVMAVIAAPIALLAKRRRAKKEALIKAQQSDNGEKKA